MGSKDDKVIGLLKKMNLSEMEKSIRLEVPWQGSGSKGIHRQWGRCWLKNQSRQKPRNFHSCGSSVHSGVECGCTHIIDWK